MARKRITQIFPWLTPFRQKQRKLFFYLAMRFDGNKYTKLRVEERLPFLVFTSSCPMYNQNTGFDMVYQENKVFNLKLAAAAFDKMLIRPSETFSFCRATRFADRDTSYKDGLSVVNGKLTIASGGGMCQLTNLLFWVFLHSPLTIVERHGHGKKDFKEPPSDAPIGVDATVAEGWLDLKVRNDTDKTFQIHISFDEECITGQLFADADLSTIYCITNGETTYYCKNGIITEEVDILQSQVSKNNGEEVIIRKLYRNVCEIGYSLPEGTPIIEKG